MPQSATLKGSYAATQKAAPRHKTKYSDYGLGDFEEASVLVSFDDLHVMVIEQIPGGVIDLRHGQLEIDLGLNETQLGQGQLGLGVQNEEYRLGAQLVLAFISMKSFAGKVR